MFTDSVLKFFGMGLKISFFGWQHYKNVVSASFQTGENTQNLARMLSQNLVQGWVKTWSKYVAQQNWTKFWLKKWCFLCIFVHFSLKSHSPCRKKNIFEKKKRKRKIGPSSDSRKGYFWTKFWLYSIKIYIRTTGICNIGLNSYFACSPEIFREYFCRICPGILHWKRAGIFGEFFLVSVSWETKHENSLKKFGESSEQNSGGNSGQKFEKFGELSFCHFFWPNK